LAQQLTFGAANITTGSGPAGMVPVDVNGDGYMDLLCANFGFRYGGDFGTGGATGTTLSVFTNDGDGNLTLSATLNVGLEPVSIAAVDVNGDGSPDLICANVGSNSVTVLTNDGRGNFAISGMHTVGTAPVCVTTADVNGDGFVDLISADWGDDTLTVLTNDGHGYFNIGATVVTGANPNCVAAGDINGDGTMDLICANGGTNTLETFTNNGRGVFTLAATINIAVAEYGWVVATDVDHDGTVDLIAANGGTNVNVLTNDGNGNFSFKSTVTPSSLGVTPMFIAADMNGDGNVDFVCPINGNGIPGYATVLTNDGHGNFTADATIPIGVSAWQLFGGNFPNFATAADFTGNGNVDVAVSCYGTSNITVLIQTNVSPRPTVTITSPANDSLILTNEGFEITAAALSPSNIEVMLYYLGTNILASSTNAPYDAQIPAGEIPAGTHALQAAAIDSAGHIGWSAEIQINVTPAGKVAPPPTPQLTIMFSGTNLTLTWPAGATNYTLQSSPNLGSPTIWSTVLPALYVVNGQDMAIVSISGTQQFFRLATL
jgi:hypothetical protein